MVVPKISFVFASAAWQSIFFKSGSPRPSGLAMTSTKEITMILSDWLVTIAGGGFACASAWLLLRNTQLKERAYALGRIYEQTTQEKTQLAELLSLAQKEIATLSAEKQMLGHAQDSMKLEFRNTANQLFEEVSAKFSLQSEQKIGNMLAPLKERIGEFQKKVDDSFGTQRIEQNTLKAEIARIVNMNEQMRLQTENLTKALRGDVKAQGNWGEVMLERILEESGLIKNADYTLQGEEMGLTGEHGGRLKPDVIVNLPDGKHVIIDAKVSLTAYERYCREPDDTGRAVQLREFITSIKNHITGLEKKRYQDIEKLSSPDFVFMFLPVEGAYSLALQHDQELHSFAWNRKIALVCPSTLFASLSTIASLWRIEKQNRNVQEIAREAGGLYDKVVGFVSDMQDIGKKLGSTQAAYDDAFKKLSDGTGNIVKRVENLKTLGAKTTKSLPRDLVLMDDA